VRVWDAHSGEELVVLKRARALGDVVASLPREAIVSAYRQTCECGSPQLVECLDVIQGYYGMCGRLPRKGIRPLRAQFAVWNRRRRDPTVASLSLVASNLLGIVTHLPVECAGAAASTSV